MLFEHTDVAWMILFFIIYGVTGAVPLIAALYLLLRRGNAFVPEVTPPVRLRHWAAAFFGVSALGHVWWYIVYITSADCHSMGDLLHSAGYVTAVALDFVTLQTTIAGVLLAMLQDRRRPVWPAFVATIPFMALCVALLVSPSYRLLQAATAYVLLLYALFMLYVAFAVRQYGRWLRDNYADLKRKEVWQSLVIIVAIFVTYSVYSTNAGELYREYMAQVVSILIFIILLWRVETLHDLSMPSPQPLHVADGTGVAHLLRERCEEPELYLHHGLTLADLSAAVGISRGALSEWFIEHGDRNFNGYIHRLRINHFVRLYGEAVRDGHPFTVFSLARQCGYRNYLRFSTAFRRRMDCSLTSWTKRYTLSAIGEHLPD